jgi:hypothetical protein
LALEGQFERIDLIKIEVGIERSCCILYVHRGDCLCCCRCCRREVKVSLVVSKGAGDWPSKGSSSALILIEIGVGIEKGCRILYVHRADCLLLLSLLSSSP